MPAEFTVYKMKIATVLSIKLCGVPVLAIEFTHYFVSAFNAARMISGLHCAHGLHTLNSRPPKQEKLHEDPYT